MKHLFCALAAFAALNLFCSPAKAQTSCAGSQIFGEKKCKGDDDSKDERQLLRLINEYRAQNNLPAVVWSDALGMVANRHLLDLQNNVRATSNSWSNCPYDIKNRKTWNCVFDAPERLGSGYTGRGYENVYRAVNKKATPVLALMAWKASLPHNALLMNLSYFKNDVYDACGIAIDGDYAILWFGTHSGTAAQKNKAPAAAAAASGVAAVPPPYVEPAGLGLNLEKAVANLNKSVVFPKMPSPFVNKKWTASSLDKSIMLEIYGSEANISSATIKIRARLIKNRLAPETQNVIEIFLSNLIPNWKQRNRWAEDSLRNLLKNPKTKQRFTVGDKMVEMYSPAVNFISLTVKPYRRLTPFQVF